MAELKRQKLLYQSNSTGALTISTSSLSPQEVEASATTNLPVTSSRGERIVNCLSTFEVGSTSGASDAASRLSSRRTANRGMHLSTKRYFCLFLCFPFLLLLFCATCLIICAVEIFYHFCYHHRGRSPWKSEERFDDGGDDRHEGVEGSIHGSQETMLLRRYLDDQLLLVIESVYNWRDEDVEVAYSRSLLLQ
ncbi:hypothetical protein H5410_050993 [Solanum commersonii]|uniref:Uncharacterized protein n=1 Tax=Solanum commersonii TaxID=4109 RepID=A0A9J5WZE7_SOLCO|nr:hypothetical protein H5410_050993 [Solanum commersonii]